MPVIRDLAKEFLRPYVEQGNSPEHICKARPKTSDGQSSLQIGGQAYVKGTLRQIGGGQVAITRFEGQDYFTTFSVVELCKEIQQELEERKRPKQQTLW